MKYKVLLACGAVLAASLTPSLLAVVPPREKPLADYDIRENALSAAAIGKPAEDLDAALLRSRVPKVQVSRDALVGTPRHIGVRGGFLTGAQGQGGAVSEAALEAVAANDPDRVVKAFVNEHAAALGHDASLLRPDWVERHFVHPRTGLRSVVWQQRYQDIPVFGGRFLSHTTADGELVSVSDQLVASPSTAAARGTPGYETLVGNPRVSAKAAIRVAAANTGRELDPSVLSLLEAARGASLRQSFVAPNLFGKTHAELTWMPLGADSMRLTWQVIIGQRAPTQRYLLLIDAETGEMLYRRNLAFHATKQMYNVFTGDSPSPLSPGHPTPSTNQPPLVEREIVTVDGALNTNASPAGWVYVGAGPTNNATRGNNVNAFTDRDWDWLPDGNFYPSGGRGPDLNYNFPLNLTNNPVTHTNASTVQLFYRANWFHDYAYELGFTEQNGNFQVTNFNRGGLGNDPVYMLAQSGADVGITDNAVFYTSPDGYEGYCEMYLWSYPDPMRDGALDSEIVVHELVHGLTDRMLGGGGGISRLQTRGLAEGWSDFYSLAMLSEEDDDPHGVYAPGAYALYNFGGLLQNYYFGVRRYPYSTDMTKNPLTLKDIDPTQASAHRGIPMSPVFGGTAADEVHNMGEVWCMVLWEMRANLIDDLGWEQGNRLALELVTDGLLLSPPNCTYLEARDGILTADRIYTGGAFYDQIWKAFAKRGMGDLALVPVATTTRGVVESYHLPADIAIGPEDGQLEVKVNPPSGSVLLAMETNVLYVRVSDTKINNSATVAASVESRPLTFVNNGQSPDRFANDGTYSANFVPSTNVSSLTIPVVVNAPEKNPSTSVVTYVVVPLPPNDNFANSFKVPASGGSFFTSNKRATMETNEPPHTASADSSLWYNYTPTVSGDVLVDTTGSEVRTVVAVYTNSALADLSLVASATGNSVRPGAFLTFKGLAGVVYRIAVASSDGRSTGAVQVRIGQGIVADTLAPFTTVTSPQNGFSTTTNRITIRGAAVDPDPNPSGIKMITINVSSGVGEMVTTTVYPPRNYGGPPSTNWTANVGLRPGLNKLLITSLDWAGNRSTPVTLQVNYRAIDPPNDLFATAVALTNRSGVLAANTRNASKELGEPNHAGFAGGRSAWWSFAAEMDGILEVSTTNSTFDTVMAIYTGNRVDTLTPLAANDDAYLYAPGGFSQIRQPVRAGETYRIAVDGYDAAGGAMFLSYNFSTGVVYRVNISTSAGGSVSPSSVEVPAGTVLTFTATPELGNAFSIWSGDVVSMSNPLTVTVGGDLNLKAEFLPTVLLADDFETGDLSKLNWVVDGAAPWFVESGTTNPAGGTYAARSGAIAGNQTSSLKLVSAFRTGDASFELRVNSEPVWDRLAFYMDGQLLQQWSGDVTWRSFAFPIGAGTHTLEWRYSKDSAGSVGLDAAYIDNLRLPIAPAIDGTTPAVLALREQSNGKYYIELTGQVNQQYTLQRSDDLQTWTDLATQIATTGLLRFEDSDPNATEGARYYRAVVR